MREDKGQNQSVIEWLQRVEAHRPFLMYGQRVWTYGDALAEVGRVSAVDSGPLTPATVFGVIRRIDDERQLTVESSGTTGAPKAITLTLSNLEAAAKASAEHLGHGPEDNWLLAMPLTHVGGLSILVRQLYAGGSVTMLPVFQADRAAAAMNGNVTMVSVVPTMLRRLLSHGPFRSLRAVLVGGGPIPPGLLEEAVELGMPVLPTYGMTETFGQVATLRPGEPLAYVTYPLPGIEMEIRDGRIVIRGDQVSHDVVDHDGWFVTNDLGELNEDGALRVLGRADTMIITGGENVSPERVEAVLAPHVDDVVVVGIPDAEWGQLLVCFYVGDTSPETKARDILHGPMLPKRFVRIERIPKTVIGKPDRSALEEFL